MAKVIDEERVPKDVETLRELLRAGHGVQRTYGVLLGLRQDDTATLPRLVERGLSYRSVERLQQNMRVSRERMADLVRIPPRTLARRREQGRLEPDESDRLLRLSRVLAEAIGLFEGDFHAARNWLFSPQRALRGETPIEVARSEVGAREVENLIGQLEHGIPS